MSDWTGGYVSDVEYVPGFYGEQAPSSMDMACIMSGLEPVRRPGANTPFAYCDLGCGQAGTVSALAAANPAGQFWGIDLMPAHIARADSFRRAAGLENLTLIEADVAALAEAADPGLPQFDYIAMHGLFSWVSEPVRAGIIRFLDRFLRPGGAVYIGYNALPGWTDVIPSQKLLYEYAATQQGSSLERMTAALDFLQRMIDAGAHGLDSSLRERLFKQSATPEVRERHLRYLAHEFLNGQWQPRFHMDVARELAAAKLEYVGSGVLLENFSGIGLSEEGRAMLDTVPPGPLRETVEDFLQPRRFRRDIFVRGRREITSDMREAMLADAALAMRAPRPAPGQRDWPMLNQKFSLDDAVYGPVFDRLEQGPATIAELRAAAQRQGRDLTGNELLGLLTGLELVLPVLQDVPGAALASCYRHNRAVMTEAFRSVRSNVFHLAVPAGHTAIPLNSFQTLMLEGLMLGLPEEVEALTAHVLKRTGIDPDSLQAVDDRRSGARDAETPPPTDPDPDLDKDTGTDTDTDMAGTAAVLEEGRVAITAAPARGDGTDTAVGTADSPDSGAPTKMPAGQIIREVLAEGLKDHLPLWRQLGLLPPRNDG